MSRDAQTNHDLSVNVQLLKIPVHLAFLLDKAHNHPPLHSETNLKKCNLPSHYNKGSKVALPQNIDDYALNKFVKLIGSKNVLGCRNHPLMEPFLLKLFKKEEKDTAQTISELILRLLHDKNLSPLQEFINGSFLYHMALSNPLVQQEILTQLMSQAIFYKDDRGRQLLWLHMANILSCLCPSNTIYPYVLKFVSDHGDGLYQALCQEKLLTSSDVVRCFPPSTLEWKANQKCSAMALNVSFSDDDHVLVGVESSSSSASIARRALMHKSQSGDTKYKGWSVCLEYDENVIEPGGHGYVLDPIACLDMPPFWNEIGGTCDHKVFLIAYPSDKPSSYNFGVDENGMRTSHENNSLSLFTNGKSRQISGNHVNNGISHDYWFSRAMRANLNAPASLHLDINETIHGVGDGNPNPNPAPNNPTAPANLAPSHPIPPFAYDFSHQNYMYPGLVGPGGTSSSSFSSANDRAVQIQSAMHVNQLQHNYLQSSLQTELYRSQLEAAKMSSFSSLNQPWPAPSSMNHQPPVSHAPTTDKFTNTTEEEKQQEIRKEVSHDDEKKLSEARAADVHRINMKERSQLLEGKILLLRDQPEELPKKSTKRVPKKMPSFRIPAETENQPPRMEPLKLKREIEKAHPREQQVTSLNEVLNVKTKKFTFMPQGCYTYTQVPWVLRVKKEFIYPNENIQDQDLINLIFCQIVRDTLVNPNIRMTQSELQRMTQIMDAHSITPALRKLNKQTERTKHFIIETAKSFSFYFGRFIPVKLVQVNGLVSYWLVVSHSGIQLAYKQKQMKLHERNELVRYRLIDFKSVVDVEASNQNASLNLSLKKENLELKCSFAESTKKLINSFCKRYRKSVSKFGDPTYPVIPNVNKTLTISPNYSNSSKGNDTYSMLRYGMAHFKIRNSEKEVLDQLRWSKMPLKSGLIDGHSDILNKIASECSLAILTFCGDYPMETQTEKEDYVYLLLKIGQKYSDITDEVFSQLCRQTNNTRSEERSSNEKGWLLFKIFSMYFTPSRELLPHISAHLKDLRYNRINDAMIVLENINKTFNFGVRKELPLPSELHSLIKDSSLREMEVKTPGMRSMTTIIQSSTIVEEVVKNLCESMGIVTKSEVSEFSLCYISENNPPVPLKSQNYIFDTLTELERQNNTFFFYFFRCIWLTPINLESISDKYLTLLFDEIVSYFTSGDWLIAPGGKLKRETENEIVSLLILAHHTIHKGKAPTEKTVQQLIPSYTRYLITGDVMLMLQNMSSMSVQQTMKDFIERISNWRLFGVMNYSMKTETPTYLLNNDHYIIAINKHGVQFLRQDTREIMECVPLNEIEHIQMIYQSGLPVIEIHVGRGRIIKFSSNHGSKILYLLRQYTKVLYLSDSTLSEHQRKPKKN